jgi:transcription antitermination protein NusB
MNIQARILARKIIMTYLYERYIAYYAAQNESVMKEVADVQLIHSVLEQDDLTSLEDTQAMLAAQFPEDDYDDDITYIIQNCFEKLIERGIDSDYIQWMSPAFSRYATQMPHLINTYATTFQYEDMDVIDRVIFLLWYAEFQLLKTPKEIILNEMIELAKKYGDEGSSKLINGILHKVLTGAEEEVKK